MATLGNTPRPAYVYDTETDTWVPIGVGAHTHPYIASTLVDNKGDLITATANDTPAILSAGTNNHVLMADSAQTAGLKYAPEATATLTTTGDLLYASAANTLARRAIGSTGDVLTVSGGLPTWAAPASGANWSLVNAGGTSLTAAATITVSGISSSSQLMVLISNASSATIAQEIYVRINSDSGANYNTYGPRFRGYSTYNNLAYGQQSDTGVTSINLGAMSSDNASSLSGYVLISGCNTSGVKVFNGASHANAGSGGADHIGRIYGGYWSGSATISSISILTQAGNFDSGTIWVYRTA